MADENEQTNIPPEQYLEISKALERLKAIFSRLESACPNISAPALDTLAVSIYLLEHQLETDDLWPIHKEEKDDAAQADEPQKETFNVLKDGPCQKLPLKLLSENNDKTTPSADDLNDWFKMGEDGSWPAE